MPRNITTKYSQQLRFMKNPIFRHAGALQGKVTAISKPMACPRRICSVDEHPSVVVENHLHPNPPATCDFPTTSQPSVPSYSDDASPDLHQAPTFALTSPGLRAQNPKAPS
ncbi:hypothetical protein D9611_014058 [Ephemerocybe angulata]|uniref:Uncharacterized protein n=1 Tax=Ephemerocybe angulata TaxID=980116 RepID=A0A8H5ERG9_9AGAR|nr:hypothetical protein D9611_014058 [Tulosesus angulatus]